jgi:hypothetical protein
MSAGTPRIIALTGPAGAGKDSVADALHHLAGFQRVAFAGALYAEVCIAFGVPLKYLQTRETKELPMPALALMQSYDQRFVRAVLARNPDTCVTTARSPRWVMQQWGTEYRRAQDPEYWTRRVERVIDQSKAKFIVITDVRFENEAQLVQRLGGTLWRVERPGHGVTTDHASDTTGAEWPCSAVILNDGDLDDLRLSVAQALEMGRCAA